MNDEDLRAAFGKYGDIKSIGPADKSRSTSTSDRVVEFFDSRVRLDPFSSMQGTYDGCRDARTRWII
jgi:hypothetical protein